MKTYLDSLFIEIDKKISSIDSQIAGIKDEENAAVHGAQGPGAGGREEAAKSIQDRLTKLENQKKGCQFLKTEMQKYDTHRNLDMKLYISIIQDKIIKKLDEYDHRNSDGSVFVRDLVAEFHADYVTHNTQPGSVERFSALLSMLEELYPFIKFSPGSCKYSFVRRMKMEKKFNIPIGLRSGFGVSVKSGKAANKMTEEEWEDFYASLREDLKTYYGIEM
jgi:hypothetical protein